MRSTGYGKRTFLKHACMEVFLLSLILVRAVASPTGLADMREPLKKYSEISLSQPADCSTSNVSLCARIDSTMKYIFIIARPTQFMAPEFHQASMVQPVNLASSSIAVNKKEASIAVIFQDTRYLVYRKQIDRA
jgi:hypothetical protein